MLRETLALNISHEISLSHEKSADGDLASAFEHLERAHILGQSSTTVHTKIHWEMFKVGLKRRDIREIWGQIVRIIGAATKTPFGIYPKGNTGGSDIWFFKPLPIPDDLQQILAASEAKSK